MDWLTELLRRPRIGWWDLLDIALVSFLIYELLLLIRGTRAVPHTDLRQRRLVAEPANVIHDRGARIERRLSRRRLVGVDGERDAHLSSQAVDDRHHPPPFLGVVDRIGAGPGRLAANVDDVGAVIDHPQTGVDRGWQVEQSATVRERIGGDVDHAHDERALTQQQVAAAGQGDRKSAAHESRAQGPGLGPQFA